MIKKSQSLMSKNNVQASDTNEHRRIQDSMENKNITHTMNFERRVKCNERRRKNISSYTGPVRRFNIDRRISNEDRRD